MPEMNAEESQAAGTETCCGFCGFDAPCKNFPRKYGRPQFSERWLCEICASSTLSNQMLYPTGSAYEHLGIIGPEICRFVNMLLTEIRALKEATRG